MQRRCSNQQTEQDCHSKRAKYCGTHPDLPPCPQSLTVCALPPCRCCCGCSPSQRSGTFRCSAWQRWVVAGRSMRVPSRQAGLPLPLCDSVQAACGNEWRVQCCSSTPQHTPHLFFARRRCKCRLRRCRWAPSTTPTLPRSTNSSLRRQACCLACLVVCSFLQCLLLGCMAAWRSALLHAPQGFSSRREALGGALAACPLAGRLHSIRAAAAACVAPCEKACPAGSHMAQSSACRSMFTGIPLTRLLPPAAPCPHAQLAALMPPGTNIPEAYSRGSDEDQAFVQNLAIFLTAFFRAHLRCAGCWFLCGCEACRTWPSSSQPSSARTSGADLAADLFYKLFYTNPNQCGCAACSRLAIFLRSGFLPQPTHTPSGRPCSCCSVLETSEELRAALVQGLDTLVAISYVDDDEVRLMLYTWGG